MYEWIIWAGIALFIALTCIGVLLYFESERYDKRFKKSIELVRAIKTQKLLEFTKKFYEEDLSRLTTTEITETKQDEESKDTEGSKGSQTAKNDFPTPEEYEILGTEMLNKNRNLKKLTKKASDLKMWYDYLPKPKEFLVKAGFWSFMLGFAMLSVCLSMWVELNNINEIRYSGYLIFFWIFFILQIFKHLLRYHFVTKNIHEHMDMLREGDLTKF